MLTSRLKMPSAVAGPRFLFVVERRFAAVQNAQARAAQKPSEVAGERALCLGAGGRLAAARHGPQQPLDLVLVRFGVEGAEQRNLEFGLADLLDDGVWPRLEE